MSKNQSLVDIKSTPKLYNDASLLRISEVFYSIQGESHLAGCPTYFIRLTGCPLRCSYCDSAYAFTGGELLPIRQLIQDIPNKVKWITITGGEPLAQPGCIYFLNRLCDDGFSVSIETSGALDISQIDQRVIIVMDVKTPGSKEVERNLFKNFLYLSKKDDIKFVISDRYDFDWSIDIINHYQLFDITSNILFSPEYQTLSEQTLVKWILDTGLPIRFQFQLHKLLWGDVPGH